MFKTEDGVVKLFGTQGQVVNCDKKSIEEIIPLAVARQTVLWATLHRGQIYSLTSSQLVLYNLFTHQVECLFSLPATAVNACLHGNDVWVLFECSLLIMFGVICDEKTKVFAAKL